MAQLIEFPQNRTSQPPLLAGHVLKLNQDKARTFQCGGFFVGPKTPIAVVDERAQMGVIQLGLDQGILTDITAHPEIWKKPEDPGGYQVQDTGLKSYTGTRQFFRNLRVEDNSPDASGEETVLYSTSNEEEQKRIEDALAVVPVTSSGPTLVKNRSIRSVGLLQPPGMDDPDRYLLKVK